MKTILDRANGRLLLELANDAELADLLQRSRAAGVKARLRERLDEGEELQLAIASRARRVELPCRVRQVFRSGAEHWGTMLEVLDWAPADEVADGDHEATSEGGPEAADVERVGETQGTSAIFAIKKLNPTQRALMASKASRPERQALLRDRNPQVLMALLNHPRLESKEVAELVKNPQVPAGVLQRIAGDRRYSGNYEIQLGLVKNPRTPSPVAIRLVELLRRGDLRDLAKSQSLREDLRRVVLRVYLKRSQGR